MIYNKLVRDHIPDHISYSGKKCKYRRVTGEEKLQYLYSKLDEEVAELHKASTREEILEELVDIQEVLDAIKECEHVKHSDFICTLNCKRYSKGCFNEGIVLEEVETIE